MNKTVTAVVAWLRKEPAISLAIVGALGDVLLRGVKPEVAIIGLFGIAVRQLVVPQPAHDAAVAAALATPATPVPSSEPIRLTVLHESPVDGQRLGRHVHHDPRSRNFPAPKGPVVTSIFHRHYGVPLDQKAVGSCTGNALTQWLNTAPEHKGKVLGELTALTLYEKATQIDSFPGSYPPDDTGSTGLDVCKAGVQLGYLTGYQHVFGIDHARQVIGQTPFIVGTNWHSGMDQPDPSGLVRPTGAVRGGHEYLCLGFDNGLWWFLQSWGHTWGVALPQAHITHGAFAMTDADFAALLAESGDITVPIR